MLHGDALGLLGGAVALGAVHGVEPGHGWPVAASYALDRTHTWLSGLAASLLIGVGHLISSIAVVLAFFLAKEYFQLTQVNDPLTVPGGVRIGGPISIVAGLVLIGLGVREYRHGHGHGHDGRPDHSHDTSHPGGEIDHDRTHRHIEHGTGGPRDAATGDEDRGPLARLHDALPSSPGHRHGPETTGTTPDRGLLGLAWFAFLLGFAHEEEFEIIALCAGSSYCLELMTAYAIAVIAGIVSLTMLLIAGYTRAEARLQRYTPYLPVASAVVLIGMGVGFVVGLF
jgi:ABC-type nickel/cobalt efflux system permease component RcnA